MLTIKDLTYRIAGRTLLDTASAVVPDGDKIGLVGRNGTGKTTLFKLITGDISQESGTLSLRKEARIGQVAQEAPATDESLISFVLRADTERTALLAEAETAEDPNRIAEIQVRLADIESHSAEARAAAILHGLGFDHEAQQRPCHAFSGGWRMRVALAGVLFARPDLLLLDEPTNYLDLEGTVWLETYLSRYPYTVIIISHDRDLLNNVVGRILHLDQGQLTSYRGGYDQFERQRREKQALQQKLKDKQDAARKHMEAFVERFRAKATKARQAQSRLKALEKMEPVAALIDSEIQPIRIPDPEKPASPPILRMEKLIVGYDQAKPVLRRLDLRIDPDDRIALLGANGNGKSTFAKLISGRLEPFSGTLTRADKLDIAYFAQHQLDELVPSQSAVDHVRALMPDAPEAKVRARVAQMGLATSKMETAAQDLSGGEKARLLLGLATFSGAHLVILDEPTNHLDVDSRQTLIQAINDYQGAVLLISHDRHLVEAVADRLWIVRDGTVQAYDGDLTDYRRLILSADSKQDRSADQVKTTPSAQDRRKQAADRRKETAPLRKTVKALEDQLETLQTKLDKLDKRLATPDLFTDHPEKGVQLSKERADTERLLLQTEEDWLERSAELEEAMAD
ncbi:ABC-F family ATP-binding cassette domain-containing protein [Coralliovum pocilloporae]|uniref:ABC-F family ATP-binding cassette domain-containing protein n=1 Tax=Coralliovum pocilloporae TaxID=3066369 RepID=UPI003307819C